MNAYALTDVGKTRQMNQDYVYCNGKPVGILPNLYIVADGMGGHKAGDLASKFSVQTFVDYVSQAENDNPISIISDAISYTNKKLIELASQSEDYTGMGTTFVVATVFEHSVYIANVGDSRVYVYDHELKQVTRDHSFVEELVASGKLERSEARTHKRKNVITRAMGGAETVVPDFFEIECSAGSQLLLCSDGLTNMVTDETLEEVLESHQDIVKKAEQLVTMANENGGLDNISVVIIEP